MAMTAAGRSDDQAHPWPRQGTTRALHQQCRTTPHPRSRSARHVRDRQPVERSQRGVDRGPHRSMPLRRCGAVFTVVRTQCIHQHPRRGYMGGFILVRRARTPHPESSTRAVRMGSDSDVRAVMATELDAATIHEIAVVAQADPRTVRVVASGGKARGMVDRRVRRELAARGILPADEF